MGERPQKTQKVAQIAVCHCSEHHAVFVGCQHQRCSHYCFVQGRGATLTLEIVPYRLQPFQFVASQLAIFAVLPRTMDLSNAKLGEGIKRLFKGLLAVFHVGKLSMQ